MGNIPPELQAHREWLGQIQQVGLVVSPQVLIDNGVFVNKQKSVEVQTRLRELLPEGGGDAALPDLQVLVRDVLEWPDGTLVTSDLPESLTVALTDYEDALSPDGGIRNPDVPAEWLALVSVVPAGTPLDKAPDDRAGWRATPHARLERLLRDTNIPIGLLFNGTSLRLVYAPTGESSGHLTFEFKHLVETLGRPMAGALHALLGPDRVTDQGLEQERLPFLLHESRKYQNTVSTELAGQVLEALWELLRGVQRVNEETKGQLLADVLRDEPGDVYGGLLTTLMRLVFILYAEDRGLMPASEVYQQHYAVSGLFERLRGDQALNPDTMDGRYGAWAQLLVLFRLIHDGGGHGDLRFPPRHGRLFDPDAYPFLEGRSHGSRRQAGESVDPPKIADGVVYRVLQNLLVLEGERLSYRALDVEQIGSVYEAMMGFALQQATGPSIGAGQKHVVVNLETLLEQRGKDRAAWLKEQSELKLTGDSLANARTTDEVVAALGKKVSRYTPHVLKLGDLFLQPTEERRRSGSHYTPRSLTAPIVQTTFRPIFDRLGERATPEQILDLKVCDPAMGSGAFLVEACRLLAERLVRAWEVHKATPRLPPDEEPIMFARRQVAEHCLYGVDKNPFAVDLAKLSLWLATLAKDHPFTFVDDSLRHGDSLVGLSREQIASLHWAPSKDVPLMRQHVDARIAEAQRLRLAIQEIGEDDVPEKARVLREADAALADVRLIGDVIVSAFFAREKLKEREVLRAALSGKTEQYLGAGSSRPDLLDAQNSLRHGERPVPAFHWEIEFPEVFTRENGGFDAFVGNPPFLGGRRLRRTLGGGYFDWLLNSFADSSGNADLAAFFFRRAFGLSRRSAAFGLIATNTIAQGDTRGTGLRWIRHHGGTIFEARKRVKWPGAAAVIVSVVHVAKGSPPGPFLLDGRPVDRITAFLFHAGIDDDPVRLKANENKSFQGSIILGMGFTFDDTDKEGAASPIALMHELVRKDPRNAERIFPYIGGEEVNDSPTHAHHRYVINFDQMSEEEARRWPDLMAIVEQKVKPERTRRTPSGAFVLRAPLPKRWWQYSDKRPALYAAIRGLERVLFHAFNSQYIQFALLPSGMVYAGPHNVFSIGSHIGFGVLQSRAHDMWARFLGSSLGDGLRYTPTDCFETFPFPSGWESDPALAAAGREYYEFRAALMVRNNEGLTKTYNRFHDPDEHEPDIVKLRELHDAMDRSVLDAYGWGNIRPTCEFLLDYEDDEDDTPGKALKKKPWRYRWPDEIRDEVLGRLLELNAQRAKEEELAGAPGADRPKKTGGRKKQAGTPLLD